MALAAAMAVALTFAPGLYRDQAGNSLYVAPDVEDAGPIINSLDPATQYVGILKAAPLGWTLKQGVFERRLTVEAPEGRLGVSLYYAGAQRRAAIILIHGNEDQTREMGFLVPLFAINGIDVISYDQRGTGESAGQWRTNGPEQRARDVAAIYDALATDPRIDPKRVGLWAFSNGGWTAPIVALRRPIAFMILIGAPAETIADNIYFEIRERMRHAGFDQRETADAVEAVRAYLDAAFGTASWQRAQQLYDRAVTQKWFALTGLRPNANFPPPRERIDAIRRSALYDPQPTLIRVTTPTLALFGALDRSVDVAHAAPTFRADFGRAGMSDFTMHVYENAGHSLVVSSTGYEDQPATPLRMVAGYAQVMIDWLRRRGFLSQAS